MIAKLTGIVDATGDGWAVVDVGGVGYLVSCSGRTLSRISSGDPVSLAVETHVREDAIQLFGFADPGEREWFRLLNGVQGVGAKAALAILTVLSPADLSLAIASGDRSAMTRAAGVGPKLASRVLNELKDKVGGLGPVAAADVGRPTAAGAGLRGDVGDAVAALVNLGFGPSEAMTAVTQVAGRLGGEAGIEALIRGGLAHLAPRSEAS